MGNEIPMPLDWGNEIVFCYGSEVIMILDKDGMVYKGQRIEDAGDAHKAFIETMRRLGINSDGM